jgi:uncharacterized protein YlxP (DUF503 family)
MIVACLRIRLHLPDCNSLKQKRFVLKSLKDRLRRRFNVAVCEYGSQDKWQIADIGIATVTTGTKGADRALQGVINYLENDGRTILVDVERETY